MLGPANCFVDNNKVIKSMSNLDLHVKKYNLINYNAVRESVVAGIMQVVKEDTLTNLADLLTDHKHYHTLT